MGQRLGLFGHIGEELAELVGDDGDLDANLDRHLDRDLDLPRAGGEKGFNELARAVGGCNSATLTQRLEHLEQLHLIHKRTEDAQVKLARSVYSLTPAGQELQGVIDAIDLWARRHLNLPDTTSPDGGCSSAEPAQPALH